MKITPVDKRNIYGTAGSLKPGDVFIRDASQIKEVGNRESYLVLYQHSRLAVLKHYQSTRHEVVCVQVSNGKLSSVTHDQRVLKLNTDNLRLEICE